MTRSALLSARGLVLLAGTSCILLGTWLVIRVAGAVLGDRWPSEVWVFLLGAAVASIPWTIAMVTTSMDGSASWRLGADGEEWTGDLLEKLGNGWVVEHNVPFATEFGKGEVDIDH